MRWFARFFYRRGAMGTLMLVLILALLGFGGLLLEIPMTVVLMVIIILLFVAVALLARSVLKANRAATGIEASIRKQAERDLAAAPPENRADIERMQERLEQAIAQLKQSKLAGEGLLKSGRRALYALPWYVFIGPPGAGKTTALLHSGLRFPGGTDRLRGVGGTRNCDWFLSDQAILLDTAGRYTTEEQDRDEWLAFLGVLKKHRPERPINGVMVGISLPDILEASPDEVDWHAETIRKRIDELSDQLGVRFPVYVVFTKADLVQGFVEFFGEMDRQERDQVWGCTFDPEAIEPDGAGDAFRNEFDLLHEALVGLRAGRLRRPMKRDERHRVFTFPLEFEAAREPLARFVDGLFRSNPFHEEPVFRGFYLTSGTQEGLPIDRVIQAIAGRFDLPQTGADLRGPQTETKSYFLTDVFTRVVVPDRELARPTGKARKRARLATTGAGMAAIAFLVLFVLIVSQGLVRSQVDLNRLEAAAADVADITWASTGFAVQADLARLEEFRDIVGRFESGRPVAQVGLDRRRAVREPAQRAYYRQAQAFLEAHAISDIRESLRTGGVREAGGFETALSLVSEPSAEEGGDRERTLRRQRVYDDLKAYLLLSDEVARLADERQHREYLRAHLTGLAHRSVVGRDTTGRGQLAGMVSRQVDAYVNALTQGHVTPLRSESGLIARAREQVYERPTVAGLYNRIKQDALFALEPLTLAHAMPGQYIGFFESGAEVPGVFTMEAWEEVIGPAFARESEDPSRDDWVMGRTNVELPAEMRDPAQIRQQLEDRYFTEYAQAWERFLRSIRYRSFGDMRSTSRLLVDLSSNTDSPLLWILSVATDHTLFANPDSRTVGEQVGGVTDRIASRLRPRADQMTAGLASESGLGRRQGTSGSGDVGRNAVERAFSGLHALNAPQAPEGNASPELYGALDALAQLAGIVEGLASEPAQAADFAAQVVGQNGGPLAQILAAVETGTRSLDNEVRQTLFIQPIRQAWGDIASSAQGHLNRRWRDEVHSPYQAMLEGRYPLDPNSSQDAPLGDFEQFFSPAGGVLASFIDQALAPFLTSDGRSARSWQGRGIGISPAAQRAIEQGRRIGEGLFSGSTMRVEFEMQADVPTREGDAPPPDQVYTRIHGTSDSYRMGSYRPWVPYVWPGAPGAMIGVSTRQGELTPRRFDGDWAVFRLLQDAEVRGASATQMTARWAFRQPGQFALMVRYDVRVRRAGGPLADPGGFFRFACPPSLS